MSANVKAMFYAGEVPWHGSGVKVEKEVTAKAAIKLAELDNWKLHTQPIFLKGKKEVDGIPVLGQEVPNKQAVVRGTDNKIMGVVGPNYVPIPNEELFDFLDDVVGEGQAIYHTAGALFDGEKVFITIKLTEDMMVGQDPINKYLLLAAGHDGTMAVHVKFTPIRVVCSNTMSAALGTRVTDSNKKVKVQDTFVIRHTNNYKNRVSQCREALKLSNTYYKYMEEQFNKLLLEVKISDKGMAKFITDLIPDTIDDNGNKKESTKKQNTRDHILEIYNTDDTIKNFRGTKWAVYNSVTTFIDHNRPTRVQEGKKKEDVRMDSILYKGGAILRQKAYDLLTVGNK